MRVLTSGTRSVAPGTLAALLFGLFGTAAALSIDVVDIAGRVKGDEATYVAMAFSVAYDGDLAYEDVDLQRFYQIYQAPPEGIFLKRGQTGPFAGRLSFGKPYLHAVLAAPFVWLFGLNGLLVFNVVLLAGVIAGGSRFLAVRSPDWLALTFTLAFVGASITPLYLVWLTPEVLYFALAFYAYFLWLYKEVAPPSAGVGRWLHGSTSDVGVAVLLGLATFSKLTPLGLFAPCIALYWWRRRFRDSILLGGLFLLVTAAAFGANALMTGEANYQGGDRRTFYSGVGGFPFEPGVTFGQAGIAMSTNEITLDEPPTTGASARVLFYNVAYFFTGRHFGLVPFFFPGTVALLLCLWNWRRLDAWHVLTLSAFGVAIAVLLVALPYSWSGGGGPSGNRYFLTYSAVLLFLMPPMTTAWPALCAWIGGATFTAQIVMSPFVSARQPYVTSQQGALRFLPVELTMVNDLPVNLNQGRWRVPYGRDPQLFLYFLDNHASLPEPPGIWIRGGRTAEIIVRTGEPVASFELRLESPVTNRVVVSAGGDSRTVALEPNRPSHIVLEPRGVYARESWAYLLSVGTQTGFVPRLSRSDSGDSRYLGATLNLSATRPAS